MAHADKLKLLFLCTGNSCRSQMAEGWVRSLHPTTFEVCSAGLVARGLDPRAVRVMAEAGVDISGQRSQTVDELETRDFDWVVTVCDHAREHCPRPPSPTRTLHVAFDDPPALATGESDEQKALEPYRRVRDEIRVFASSLPDRLLLD